MASAQAQENKAPIARALIAAAGVAVMQRDFEGASRAAEAALQLHREIGDREGEGEALARMATGLRMTSRMDEGAHVLPTGGRHSPFAGQTLGTGLPALQHQRAGVAARPFGRRSFGEGPGRMQDDRANS
jgi:hypothetical protein